MTDRTSEKTLQVPFRRLQRPVNTVLMLIKSTIIRLVLFIGYPTISSAQKVYPVESAIN